ncbi:Tagatose-6-phosphate kinase AgaZ [Candidatus Rhodobacter oscarellae]|uniref:Tagatose-6-phosphate kinase AgaZ n=1 Tax=Candidatus Rhodobacter oscarellae TaxID=1675527 RepID=A0A0J9H556_9RHOB|nr:class II D-tagatose-bisphosphate aldolase, non-catalytic subunit [Candidatus Rhodobacter lobularis]KMW60713.1 Tagatose-6-phosphate kinase AgaZ [Candidatus Rhodobacter lobularis]
MSLLDQIIRANRAGHGPAIPSVCSAHPDVLTASLLLARSLDRPLLIEATSNQVNHHGGYTGQTPADFIAGVRERADGLGLRQELLLFGGDHLGPQAWKAQDADSAMVEAEGMIAAYVQAGFTKIHLDCSEGCAGEPAALNDELAAARSAQLAEVAERAAPDASKLRYVIGTEVPPPGGARHDEDVIAPTPPDRAAATIAAHEKAFVARGQDAALTRVRGLVVQPGLEFAPGHIDHFPMDSPDHLSDVLSAHPDMCFEAHSTDYQKPEVFQELARRRVAILKVGPALTFAWREALYALSHVDVWQNGGAHISEVLEAAMTDAPKDWIGHYHGSADEQRQLRHFGYADRIRYYWARVDVAQAVDDLKARFDTMAVSAPLLWQYLPAQTRELAGELDLPPAMALLAAHVQIALRPYFDADPTC